MKNNVKIRKIEKLFQEGDVDLYKILHFLIEEFKNYKLLEFRSNSNEIIKFYRENNLNFLDIWDGNEVKLLSKYKVKYFFEIMNLREVEEMELMEKKFSINNIRE